MSTLPTTTAGPLWASSWAWLANLGLLTSASTVATSYNRLCCLEMINLGLAYGIMIQAECIPMFVTINQHFIFSYQECTLCVGLVCFHRNQSIETDLPRFVKFVSAVGSLKLFMVSEPSSRRIPPCSQLQCFSKNTSQLLFPKCAFLGSTDNGCYLLLKCPKLVNWQNLWPLDC